MKKFGGKQEGAGRPVGSLSKTTIDKKIAEKAMKERILKRLNPLLNSQFQLARGLTYIYKVVKKAKGEVEHVLVEDPDEIKEFLDEHEGSDGDMDGTWYFITVKPPENKAIDSMLDRVFGKPTQKIAGDSDDETPIPILVKHLIDVSANNGNKENSIPAEAYQSGTGRDERKQDDKHPAVIDQRSPERQIADSILGSLGEPTSPEERSD